MVLTLARKKKPQSLVRLLPSFSGSSVIPRLRNKSPGPYSGALVYKVSVWQLSSLKQTPLPEKPRQYCVIIFLLVTKVSIWGRSQRWLRGLGSGVLLFGRGRESWRTGSCLLSSAVVVVGFSHVDPVFIRFLTQLHYSCPLRLAILRAYSHPLVPL